ncbi:hypothetical protein NGM33_09230 [Nocardiopsis dassonvillei]|uniref:hypothetical protein n=1 Tax=Nocardiopsis dassonvillei TaxID=2014 RepID=UPI0020A60F27|nr:hypothetical protein [Nocardiopsis dassonvillei]MCP3013516.1 hypothetical protein [Nocardiopsis dassonvillei]
MIDLDATTRECSECATDKDVATGYRYRSDRRCAECRDRTGVDQVCPGCDRTLGEQNFRCDGDWCRDCHREASAKHHEENRETRNRRSRERGQKQRDELAKLREENRVLGWENRRLTTELAEARRLHSEERQARVDLFLRLESLKRGDSKFCGGDCGQDKTLSEFGEYNKGGKTYRNGTCKVCRARAARDRRS